MTDLNTYKSLWINPIDGVITSLGGLRINPITGRREFHDGIDIAAPIGTTIVAPKDGAVMATGVSATFGKYLQLAHADGYVSFMAHLNMIKVSTGDVILQGQHVAYSGNSGRTTGPHLHFSIFFNGQYVDPLEYVDLPKHDNIIWPLQW